MATAGVKLGRVLDRVLDRVLGRALGNLIGKRAEILGGVILVIVGSVILYGHLSGAA
jgi:putative Mn2+ efflux pump MntP